MKSETLSKAILYTLVIGCVLISPNAGATLARALMEKWSNSRDPYIPPENSPKKVRRSLYRLEENNCIKIKQVGKRSFKLELTRKGKQLVGRYQFSEFSIKPKGSWDGQWRMFVFDVPERRRTFRDHLRHKLKSLGFFQFQKSVWIHPLECEAEMQYVCEFLGVEPYTLMFTGKIHNDTLLRKFFYQERILSKSDLRYRSS